MINQAKFYVYLFAEEPDIDETGSEIDFFVEMSFN